MLWTYRTGDQQPKLVGIDFLSAIVDHADTVPVSIDADSEIGLVGPSRFRNVVQEGDVFGIRIVAREVPIRGTVELHELTAERPQDTRSETASRTIARGEDHFQAALQQPAT